MDLVQIKIVINYMSPMATVYLNIIKAGYTSKLNFSQLICFLLIWSKCCLLADKTIIQTERIYHLLIIHDYVILPLAFKIQHRIKYQPKCHMLKELRINYYSV